MNRTYKFYRLLLAALCIFIICTICQDELMLPNKAIWRTQQGNWSIRESGNLPSPFPKLFCWVLCDTDDKRLVHVYNTWIKHCDMYIFLCSQSDPNVSFPHIGLNVTPGRDHIASKTKHSWTYVAKHYINHADYFIKVDADAFMILENLKQYIHHRDPDSCELIGHSYLYPGNGTGRYFNAGGPGQVLSRGAVKTLYKALQEHSECFPDGVDEDLRTADCIRPYGCSTIDTRDKYGKETFMVFDPRIHLTLGKFGTKYPDWYFKYDTHGASSGCSDYPIGFHYVANEWMYMLHYFFYKSSVHSAKNADEHLFFLDNSTVKHPIMNEEK